MVGTSASGLSRIAIGLALVALSLLLAAPASGEDGEPTRETYKVAADPICKSTAQRIEPKLRGVKRLVLRNTKGSLRQAGNKILSTSKPRANGLARLERLPRPAADAGKLQQWFKQLRKAHKLLIRIGGLYKSGNRNKPFALERQHQSIEVRANALVIDFNFAHCKAESARFR